MIYTIKKMYKAFGNFVDRYPELRGVNPIFNQTIIPSEYPKNDDVIKSLEYASSIHKEVRRFLQPYLRPGIKLIDIANIIELKTYELSNQTKSIYKGIGFPVGLSINECAAHWHPLSNDTRTLNKNDVLKIDFGTEANGWIIDSAFTITFDQKYDNLLMAVKDATYTGIKNIGIDVDIAEWGKSIQEVMESYEISLNNQIYPIKSIINLGGHNITKGVIHGGIFLPIADLGDTLPKNYKFKEGVYAVETFGSTGNNQVHEYGDSTLFRINPYNNNTITFEPARKLLYKLKNNFSTLPFTYRYTDISPSMLNILIKNNYVHSYPPLCVNKGAFTAQYEHTVYIGKSKYIFSSNEDY